MLFDDYVLRQVQKLSEFLAAVAASARGQVVEGLDAQLAEAYRALTGLDGELVDTLTASTLSRMLGDPDAIRALAALVTAHGDLCAQRGDDDGARRRWEKALALVDELGGEAAAKAEIEERLG